MGKKQYLLAAAAPLALVGLTITPTDAAEVRKRVPSVGATPQIKTTVPATIEGNGRIRTVVTPPEEEEQSAEEQLAAREAREGDQDEEANATSSKRIRSRIPVINTSTPAEIEDGPRIRTRAPTTEGPVAVDTAEAEPSTPRTRGRTPRIDMQSVPAEIEDGPRIRTRTPATEDSDDAPVENKRVPRTRADDAEPAADLPTPRTRTRIDASTPAEIENTPRIRIRTPKQVEATDELVEEQTPRKHDTVPRIDRTDTIPVTSVGPSKADSVVLKGVSNQEILKGLKVAKTLDLSTLTKNPKLLIGITTFDFEPMLKNAKALPNIAKRLEAMPDLIRVNPGSVTASQIPQGLVVTSTLSYTLLPGACSRAENRARIIATGVSCFSYKPPNVREAAVAKPGTVDFIENLGDRAKVLNTMRSQAKAVGADIDQSVTKFRAMLQNPSERADLESRIGSAEVQRMEQLDDTALAGELVNNHDVLIEEFAFVPVLQPVEPTGTWNPGLAQALMDAQTKRLAAADAQIAKATEPNSYPIGEYNFLTGFTLGESPEWRRRVSTTISWCLVGCKKTYFAEAWAGFSYGLGMRFPMKFGGTYNYNPANGGKATLDAKLSMIDGTVADYKSTGLPNGKLFNGQELVAEFGAWAGVAANLPLIGGIGPFELKPKLALTDYLPDPFKGGNITPPLPNTPGLTGNFVLEQVDLLNNYANFGFVAAKLHPSVEINLSSTKMALNLSGKNMSKLLGGDETSIALPFDSAEISSFKAADPAYNVVVTLTPGVTARMSLNLAVWSASVDWPITFPSAQIKLSGDFTCHDGTICHRDFVLSPDGPYSGFRRDVKNWGVSFDKYWLPKCVDVICISGVKLKRYDTVEWAWAQEASLGTDAEIKKSPVSDRFAEATKAAEKYYTDSIARKAQKSSDTSAAMGILAQGIYTPQCKDSLCVDNIANLAAQMAPVAKNAAYLDPTMDAATINKMVNKEFGPKFVAEIEASERRAKMKQAASVQKQADKIGGKQNKLPKPN